METVLTALAAYCLGSISFAIVVSRLMRLPDPRSYGSGNPGATNVLRTGKKAAAALTLAGDAAKGTLAVLAARYFVPGESAELAVAAAAVAVSLGHMYSAFLRFRGGKGVATAVGVLLGVNLYVAAGAIAMWVVIAFFFRISSFAALVAAAFSGAIGAMSGPLHGGAPARVLTMIEEVEKSGDAEGYVKGLLDQGERLMGFGHRVYRAEDPRARVLRRTARELNAPRYEVAEALEKAALAELRERRPDRVLETNVEFWAAIVLDFAEVPANMFTSMFTCARTGGWSAHILEQKRTGRLVRPSAHYVGPAPRLPEEVEGWDTVSPH